MSPWIQLFLNQFGGGSYSPFQNSMPDPFADWQSYLNGSSTTVPHVPRGQLERMYGEYPQYRSDLNWSALGYQPPQSGAPGQSGNAIGGSFANPGGGAAPSQTLDLSGLAAIAANGQSPLHPNPVPTAARNYVGWPTPSGYMPPGFGGR